METELRNIRQLMDDEKNPVRKTKMINVYSKMFMAVIGMDL